jgi:hypothetical protein
MCIYVYLYESKQFHFNVYELTQILIWFYSIIFQIIWFIPNLCKFIRISFEFIWKYVLLHTAARCRTLPYAAAHCRTLPHTSALSCSAWIKMPHIAHCTLHTAQSHIAINMNSNNAMWCLWCIMFMKIFMWIYVHSCEFIYIHGQSGLCNIFLMFFWCFFGVFFVFEFF